MPRTPKSRIVKGHPAAAVFKPAGVSKSGLSEVVLTLDEFEAIRLADFEGLYQDDAAASMDVSRQTLGNILVEAHRKVADCLVNGKALKIEGGHVNVPGEIFLCGGCFCRWPQHDSSLTLNNCPACGIDEIETGKGHVHDRGCGCCGRGRRKRKHKGE